MIKEKEIECVSQIFSTPYEVKNVIDNILLISTMKGFSVNVEKKEHTFFTRQEIRIFKDNSIVISLISKSGVFDNIVIGAYGEFIDLREWLSSEEWGSETNHLNSKFFSYDETDGVNALKMVERYVIRM